MQLIYFLLDIAKKQIGIGTFGKVFLCKDLKHQDHVAIKIIRKIDRHIESAEIEKDILNDIYVRHINC